METPLRVEVPAQELHIDAIRDGHMFFRTSPEFHMKRMIVEGAERIFQLGPCWRAGESGRLHNEKFVMLEWYRVGASYLEIADEARTLIQSIANAVLGNTMLQWAGCSVDISGQWKELTVRSVFNQYAGWDPVSDYDPDRFDLDLVEKVEPSLPVDPVILKDYPRDAAAFALVSGETAERWELYIAGIEIANAYSELTDAAEQRRRLETIAKQRAALGKQVYTQDEDFLRAMEKGLPECAGVALGIDRLLMLLAGCESIQDVL